MTSRSQPSYADARRSPPSTADVKGRRRYVAAVSVLIIGLVAVIAFVLVTIIRALVALPALPAPTRKPMRQPGGLMRQVIGGPGYSDCGEWSGDGKRLVTNLDDLENRREFLAKIWDSLRSGRVAPKTFPATLWVLAIIGEDGKHPQVIRMPQGLNPTWVRWQPGTSNLAVGAMRMTVVRGHVGDEWGLWLFDTARRRLLRQLYGHPIGFESWSPDGRQLLYQALLHLRERDPYRIATLDTANTIDVPQPGRPNWIDHPQWSPDSRFVAFRYHAGPATGRPRRLATRGFWIIDVQTATARALITGRIGASCWLSDGRLIVTRAKSPFTAIASSQVGVVNLQSGRVEWFPWTLTGACSRIEEARGCIVAQMMYWSDGKEGKEHPEEDLWQIDLANGTRRRLTKLGDLVDSWRLSPQGDKVSLSSFDERTLPGTWILDLAPQNARSGRSQVRAPR
jgi:dipeptidyl aminopeptidase/acylaminoacyl peptidase